MLTVGLIRTHFIKEAGFEPQLRKVQLPHLLERDETLSVHKVVGAGPNPEENQAAIVYYKLKGSQGAIGQYYFDPASKLRLRNLGALPQLSEIYTTIRGPIWNPQFTDIDGEYIGWRLVDALHLNNHE